MATNKNKTPLLRPLRANGGTLYIFPSASEDIGINLNSRATGVALSHYALLNLPNYNSSGNNFKKLSKTSISSASDYNKAIAEDLLNYVMNFETILMNQPNYNYREYSTVSEQVFWHWLKDKMGAMSLANETKSGSKIHLEKKQSTDYNRVVLCFGSIDAGNSLSTEFGIFNETYINIPTSYGAGPVFFAESPNNLDNNIINGRTYESTNSDKALLEGRTSDNLNTLKILDSVTPIYDSESKYSISQGYEIVKDIYTIQENLKNVLNKDIVISSYDDVNIDKNGDFEKTDLDISSTIDKALFNFNAILLYYSIYDQDDTTKEPLAINAFGIIFLNGAIKSGKDYYLEPFTKKKSFYNDTLEGNQLNHFGNSYSFRVNVKTMSIYDNTDSMIQDNTTMSSIASNDFSEVISNMNRAIDVMNTNVQTTRAIQDNYMALLQHIDEQNEYIEDLSTKIKAYIEGYRIGLLDTSLLYANSFRPLEENIGNNLNFYLRHGEENGLTTYTLPITIDKNSLTSLPGMYTPVSVSTDLRDVVQTPLTDESIDTAFNDFIINAYKVNGVNQYINEIVQVPSCFGNLLKVDPNDTQRKYMDYIQLIPYLIKEIQYLKSKVN